MQWVVAVGMSFVMLVVAANLIVFVYARGVVRAAVDEGARVGSRVGAGIEDCEDRAGGVLDDLLGGALRNAVTISCSVEASGELAAHADARLPSWIPFFVPQWVFSVEARSGLERVP